jgi:alpha-methylacyl-CoA racemase
MLLAFGIVCALLEAQKSGKGQVVDAAMCDISSLLMAQMWGSRAKGTWSDKRGDNLLDGASFFYGPFETKDGKFVSIASIESQFFAELIERCKITDPDLQNQWNRDRWTSQRDKMAAMFKTKTRDEWCKILEGSDVCFAPVLDMGEALKYPHNVQRKAFVEVAGVPQPAPAPRFSRTPPAVQGPPPKTGEHNETALADWGFSPDEIKKLQTAGAI